ncbi:hypothetical protein PISMIDRAFT_688877 [Pisolithus microcarpus 441]|uniref:DUF6534 domain-containing protein n=1 Tax=Pisolithus microcarpus 441 TaxID=765257 RepID=A0A0C9Y8H3_9AGAM|nr:hypothetical protein PISMIDRAFT_688877 [Pisolithus microcarpus 441]
MGIPGGFGSILLEGLVSAMLYGVTILQTYMYFMHYSEDASATKFLVVAVCILDTLHISFICHALYHYLITNYAVLTSLEYIVWSLPASLLVNLLVVGAVQCYFAHKIYHLCRPQVGWLVTAPIILFLLTHFAFGVAVVVLTFANDEFSFLPKIRFSALIPCSAALVLVEVLITLSLCILLYDNRSHSAFPRTKCLLNTLIIYAVNRCLLTLLVALGELTSLVDNQDIWAMGLDFNIGKLYVNSFLASLNTRQYLRSQVSGLKPDLVINNPVHFENFPKLPGDEETANGGKMHREGHEVSVIDTTAVPALDKTTRL